MCDVNVGVEWHSNRVFVYDGDVPIVKFEGGRFYSLDKRWRLDRVSTVGNNIANVATFIKKKPIFAFFRPDEAFVISILSIDGDVYRVRVKFYGKRETDMTLDRLDDEVRDGVR